MFALVLIYSYIVKILTLILGFLKIGNGTTWPGLFFEKCFPSAVELLVDKNCKIILISGTNGKTTTRSMLVKIYEDQGIKVCSNRGGANILRGVASALLSNLDLFGRPNANNLILEVEEATMPIITKYIKPTKIILTNIFRDQMDAYGEIDTTLKYFIETLDNLQNKNFDLVINKDDAKLLTILNQLRPNINLIGYGISDQNAVLPDYEMSDTIQNIEFITEFAANNITGKNLESHFDIHLDHKNANLEKASLYPVKTQLLGVYNIYNLLAAFAASFDDFGIRIIDSLESVTPVFGRGEKVQLPNGSQVIMLLVKNPAGMNQVFELIKSNFEFNNLGINFLLNDNIADGRDVSWLWDCNFEDLINFTNNKLESESDPSVIQNLVKNPPLNDSEVIKYRTSGTRGLDMLLRLETAGAKVTLEGNLTNISDLVSALINNQNFPKIELVLATYTAMLEFRSELSKFVKLGGINEKGN